MGKETSVWAGSNASGTFSFLYYIGDVLLLRTSFLFLRGPIV